MAHLFAIIRYALLETFFCIHILPKTVWYITFAFFFVFTTGYFISWLLSAMNIKADLKWFAAIVPKAKKENYYANS